MTEVITKQNTLVPDAVAGLTTGIANIPDTMASAILAYLISSSQDVQLFERVPQPDGTYREQTAPAELPSNVVTVLDKRGSVFFAAAHRLEEMLPSAREAQRPVVILRLRQSRQISSTFVNVLEFYDGQLREQGGKLILAGVGPRVKEQLDLIETTQDVLGEDAIYPSTDIIGGSTKAALAAANAWLDQATDQGTTNQDERQHE